MRDPSTIDENVELKALLDNSANGRRNRRCGSQITLHNPTFPPQSFYFAFRLERGFIPLSRLAIKMGVLENLQQDDIGAGLRKADCDSLSNSPGSASENGSFPLKREERRRHSQKVCGGLLRPK
jgi:hypothetical protein